MASKAVIDAVKARLGTTWNSMAVTLPNDPGGETPLDGASYIALQFPVANVSRMTISQGVYREEGGFRVVLNAERDKELDQILTLAEQLAALFRDQKFGGLTTQVPSSPLLDDDNENGNYFVVSIVVPYTFNFV